MAGRAGGLRLVSLLRTAPGARLLVDATAAEGMAAIEADLLGAGVHVVACNKKPLAGPQADWDRLARAAARSRAAHLYEVTVGAGLPILKAIRDLRDTGDRVETIEGCVSGTLNFLCDALDAGRPFSRALAEAAARGYTEPDPREDLAGGDAARKAIILARTAGFRVEPEEVAGRPFAPIPADGDAASFLRGAARLDRGLARRWAAARRRGRRLRYLVRVRSPRRRDGRAGLSAGLVAVDADGPFGRLAGPENIFVVHSVRYHRHPLVVRGPGAGPEVTAAGAFADILEVARGLALGGAA
jgi:aspartokinase/homoserine dehydrogenase 1